MSLMLFEADFNLKLHKNFLSSTDLQPVAVIFHHECCIFCLIDLFSYFKFNFSLQFLYSFIDQLFYFKEFNSLNFSLLLNLFY
jgi:hypothetical protein